MLPRELDLSLVIACYNEERLLHTSVQELLEVLDTTHFSYEILFVDDCSQDRTRDVIAGLIASNPRHNLRAIFHDRNMGRGASVRDGFLAATAKVTGFIDIDLEVSALHVPYLTQQILKGSDVVTAHRIYKVTLRALHRIILSRGYSWLVRKLLKVDLLDTETGCKFFLREKLLPILHQTKDQHWFWDTEIMVRARRGGLSIREVPCLFVRRMDKRSSVKLFRDTCDYLVKLWNFRRDLSTSSSI